MPDGLSDKGQEAWRTIVDLLQAKDATFTGGCRAFYSPKEWAERGEKRGADSLLIVVYDGGEVGRFFSYSKGCYSLIEEMSNALEKIDCWAESCTNCYTAIYPRQ